MSEMREGPQFTDDQIEAAVSWWRTVLARPKYDALGGQRDQSMEVAQVMMSAYGASLTAAQLDAFADHLRDVLAGRCEHTWKATSSGAEYPIAGRETRTLHVDYDPDITLRHCGEVAGFPPAFFWPCKTTMWLREGGVRVAYGYGAPIVDVPTPAVSRLEEPK